MKHKTGWIIFTGIASLVICFLLFVNSIVAPIIGRKLKTAVAQGSRGLYHITFTNLSVNIFTGTVVLDNVRLTADTVGPVDPAQVYAGSIKQVIVSGAHPLKFWWTKQLDIGLIRVSGAAAELTILKAPKTKPGDNRTVYQSLAGSFRSIHIAKIALEQAQFGYRDSTESYRLRAMDLLATELLIDSATQKDTSRTLFCRDIRAGLKNFKGVSADGAYHYGLGSAIFSTQSRQLVLRGMVVEPLPADAFFKLRGADRFTFGLDSLVLAHFDYRTFLAGHFLKAGRLSAFKGNIGVYSNPHGKVSKTDRVITFPNYIVRVIKTHFMLDTLDLAGIDVHYTEFNKKSAKTGTLNFSDTKGRFLNISNEVKQLKSNPVCTVALSTVFMGAGRLDLGFKFNLADEAYAYSYQGHLAAMPLTVVNPLVMPLALAKVKTGSLQSLDFAISGDRRSSRGTLKLLYHNLDIALLDRDYREKPLKTFAANALVVSRNNPDAGTQPRSARIVFLRPENYPFFKTLWATLLSGIKPCAGLGYAVKPAAGKPLSKQEQKAKKKALKKAVKEKKKADKLHKKALQKQVNKTS